MFFCNLPQQQFIYGRFKNISDKYKTRERFLCDYIILYFDFWI